MTRSSAVALALFFLTMRSSGHSLTSIGDVTRWERTGIAFEGQPVLASQVLTDRIAPVTLGGDYWRNLTYPLGQSGTMVIATGYLRGDGPTGTLTSPSFVLEEAAPYFSFLVGGTEDLAHERIELQVRVRPDETEVARRIAEWRMDRAPCGVSPYAGGEDYVPLYFATGTGFEQLSHHIVRIPDFVMGRESRIVIVDDSASGHINATDFRLTSAAPGPRRSPVWGYADYHTHPMTYKAFGGLKGLHTIWGSPGGNYDDYIADPLLAEKDLPQCVRGHDGGPFANPFLNAVQTRQYKPSLGVLIGSHGKSGAPDFKDFPSFLAGAHQQMHITQIRRNYEGGLRLMVALATDSVGAEYLVSKVESGRVPLVKEQTSMAAQILGMIDLARQNSSWMQIAYTPAEAREIIHHNKLAIILGTEVDQLGSYFSTGKAEIDYLWKLGVRAVTPIHAANNLLGGAAVFIGPYNWLNDLLHRETLDVSKKQLKTTPTRFFNVKEDNCEVDSTGNDGDCVQLRLEWNNQRRLYIGRCLESFFRLSPCLDRVKVPEYDTEKGHKNQDGLTAAGENYIAELMDRGMIIDTAHMSDASVEHTYAVIERRLSRRSVRCTTFSFQSNTREECASQAYPTVISHAHFRGQAIYGDENFLPSEYDISNHNLEMVLRVGGVVAPFLAESRIGSAWDPGIQKKDAPVANDCAQSSKSFAYSFHYATSKVGGVGMATDFTFVPSVAPRFGAAACWAYNLAKDPQKERKKHPDRYATAAQRDGIRYKDMGPKRGVTVGSNAPLEYYQLASRAFDFNVEGLAHFGLVPDMIQDLKNIGVPREDLEQLFSSAEAYIRMWERTEALSGRE